MRKQSKFNFGCATHFFGEISKLGKKICIEFARVTLKMQLQKTDVTELP